MKHLVLVNSPLGLKDHVDLAPPAGLLTLAAVCRETGCITTVIDFNLEMREGVVPSDNAFYSVATQRILELKPDLVGFTSMCLDSHVGLLLAQKVKEASPATQTVFGGPHFGALGPRLLKEFGFVDFVVAGSGEGPLLHILRWGKQQRALPRTVWYRKGDSIRRGGGELQALDLDRLPLPAYDLVDLERYFHLNPRHVLDYDSGRGCIFKCSFCYSPTHHGQLTVHRSIPSIVRDVRSLLSLGARHLFFVQDNLLNSRDWAFDLCSALATAKLPLTWSCYATHPQLNTAFLDQLASAGCTGVFIGVDAVAPRSQRDLHKRFLKDWGTLERKLAYAVGLGIAPTCALILEDPCQDPTEVTQLLDLAVRLREIGCDVHLNTLTIYNGTDLERTRSVGELRYSNAKAKLAFDSAPVLTSNPLAVHNPALFPFHCTSHGGALSDAFVAKASLLFVACYVFPRALRALFDEHADVARLWEEPPAATLESLLSLTGLPRIRTAVQYLTHTLLTLGTSKSSIRQILRDQATWELSVDRRPREIKFRKHSGAAEGQDFGGELDRWIPVPHSDLDGTGLVEVVRSPRGEARAIFEKIAVEVHEALSRVEKASADGWREGEPIEDALRELERSGWFRPAADSQC